MDWPGKKAGCNMQGPFLNHRASLILRSEQISHNTLVNTIVRNRIKKYTETAGYNIFGQYR